MKPLAPNTLLQNRYLVVQLIGKGGMGEVYLAVDQRLGSAVALKRTLFSDEEAFGTAFEREAKMLARLRHPALTKVSDHFTENDLQYLVMEHISGDDLSKRLEENQKPFPVSWVMFWADQLLDALSYLHSHEPPIIHRDIKPQNLKLTNENHIILLDFGLAKHSVGETRLSTTGDMVAYTPHYASMEQIRGTGTTARSDIYSLCATMYQLLTNKVPPDALSRADSVLNNLPDPVPPVNEINSEVPVAIAQIIKKGMSLSADQRFASAKDMQIALREAHSQSQTSMTAETVAFNVGDEIAAESKQTDIKTEAFSVPNLSQPIGEKTELMPVDLGTGSKENGTTSPNIVGNPATFDATVPFVTPLIANEIQDSPLAGEKTAVMPFDISPTAGEQAENFSAESSSAFGEKTEMIPAELNPLFDQQTSVSPIDYSFGDDKTGVAPINFSDPVGEKTEVIPIDIANINQQTQENIPIADNSYKSSDSFNPEATVPLVNLGGQVSELPPQDTTNFVVSPPDDYQTENLPSEEISSVNEEVKPEPKKKAAGGGGKVFVILGVLALLGFLGIGAAGIGLYIYKPELFTSATPAPTPTASPVLEPTVSPTIEQPVLSDTNTNTEQNTSTELSDTNTNTNINNQNVVVDKTPNQPGDKTTPTPVRTQTPITIPKTPTTTRTPPVKTPTPPIKTPSPRVIPEQ